MPLSEVEKKRFTDLFKEVDTSGNNSLSVMELVKVVRTMGWEREKFPNKAIFSWFLDMDTDGDHSVELNEFLSAMDKRPRSETSEAQLRRTLLDMDTEKTGSVSEDQIKTALTTCTIDLKGEADSIISKAKADDGKINMEKFIGLVNFTTIFPTETVP